MGLIHAMLGSLFRAPLRSLKTVKAGETVRVRGRVAPRDLIESTLSGQRCVYFSYTVERWQAAALSQFPEDGTWILVRRDEAITEFYLVDEGCRAIVSPSRVEVDSSGSPSQIDLGGIHDERARETTIGAGDLIEVSGVAEEVDDLFDLGRKYRSPARRLLLRAPARGSTLVRVIEKATRSKDAS